MMKSIGVLFIVLFLLACAYLAACAGANRWLTFKEWIGKKNDNQK